MAGTTLSELQRRTFDRMDEGASQYISTQQCTDVINESYALLWSIYAGKDAKFFETEAVITPLLNTRDYNLPADFRQETKVYWVPVVGATPALSSYVPMWRTMRDDYSGVPDAASYYYSTGNYRPSFEIYGVGTGPVFRINPTPTYTPTFQISVWYLPNYTPLALSTDTIDARIYPGHDQFIVNQSAILLKIKEEVPYDDLAQMQGVVKSTIDADLNNRFMGTGKRWVDMDSNDGWVG